jgi:hypothetical protein
MTGIFEILADIPEVLAIILWPTYTPAQWEELNLYRLWLCFMVGLIFGMAFTALFFLLWPLITTQI